MICKIPPEAWTVIANIVLAFIALFKEYINPNSKVVINKGSLAHDEINKDSNNVRRLYYLFSVENRSLFRKNPGKGCGVYLVGIARKNKEGIFERKNIVVAWQIAWAPKESEPIRQTIKNNKICGFGCIIEKHRIFTPDLYVVPFNFHEYGYVSPGETVRYFIKLDGDNIANDKEYILHVEFNDTAEEKIEKLAENLKITFL